MPVRPTPFLGGRAPNPYSPLSTSEGTEGQKLPINSIRGSYVGNGITIETQFGQPDASSPEQDEEAKGMRRLGSDRSTL